ncbi:hypothetical protein BDZ85DRAFT_319580 [Elsinoe ampelina]|uniref:F-box domain-containing protein n=1 Tax=Elsinoe ampelina TaxID=302913 RepID=A0A6A6G9A5_9PEZI|nr:hypothetical protein BDZ85DRAFT_319580 [Elsinoe ampelina]
MAANEDAGQRGKRSHDTITTGESAVVEPPAKRPRVSPTYLMDFLDSTKYPPIRDVLVKYLDVRSMTRLCATSRHLRRSIRSREWNINRFLSHHFDDPVQFRLAQSRSAALIIGDAAFRFIEGKLHTENLHMIVEAEEQYDGLLKYLTENERFVVGTHKVLNCGSMPVLALKATSLKKGDKSITLMWSRQPSHVTFVQMQTTTASTAALTWNKAYHVFPRTTFVDFQTMPLRPLEEYGPIRESGSAEHMQWANQGWSMKVPAFDRSRLPGDESHLFRELGPTPASGSTNPLNIGRRFIGDHLSLNLALDTTGVSPEPKSDEVFALSSFDIEFPCVSPSIVSFWGRQTWYMHRPLSARLFRSPSLRHVYCISQTLLIDDNNLLVDTLTTLLYELTLTQVLLLGPAECFVLFGHTMPDPVALTHFTFKQPLWWNFYDDLVKEYILKAERFMRQAKSTR